jgi:hypothetical protein
VPVPHDEFQSGEDVRTRALADLLEAKQDEDAGEGA